MGQYQKKDSQQSQMDQKSNDIYHIDGITQQTLLQCPLRNSKYFICSHCTTNTLPKCTQYT